MNNADAFIMCRGLGRTYRKGTTEVTPLKDLDLDIAQGSFVSLMGPSGSGKTTLLNCIAGIDRPTAGTLTVGGTDLTKLSRGALTAWRARHVGYIFQLYHLVPVLTAFENVELPLLLAPMSRRERHARVQASLEIVGIADRHDHKPNQLSGGQEQRAAIARALVADPPLLVADEPTGDLDGESAQRVLELLRQLSKEHGKTIVMVTHDPRAAAIADQQYHLDKGRLIDADEVVT